MPFARYLRVVSFQPRSPVSPVDAVLREAVVPRLLDRPEILDAWIGRHGSATDQERVLASTWCDEPGGAPADLAALGDPDLADGPAAIGAVDHLDLVGDPGSSPRGPSRRPAPAAEAGRRRCT